MRTLTLLTSIANEFPRHYQRGSVNGLVKRLSLKIKDTEPLLCRLDTHTRCQIEAAMHALIYLIISPQLTVPLQRHVTHDESPEGHTQCRMTKELFCVPIPCRKKVAIV
jgi:hypothetical protein